MESDQQSSQMVHQSAFALPALLANQAFKSIDPEEKQSMCDTMINQVNIEPITDKAKIASALSLVETFTDGPYHLKLSFIWSKSWAVVPVESGNHFIPEDAKLLSQALHAIQCFRCLAVATDPLKDDMCYRISTGKEGLFEFGKKFGFLNFALFSEDISFIVLCTVGDYYLIAGPTDFVMKATRKSIQAAREEFFEFADKGWKNSKVRAFLLSVYKRYEPFNGEKAMKSDKAVMWVLTRFAKNGDQLLDEIELKGIELEELQTIFQRPTSDPMYACYPVSQTEAKYLQQYVNEPIDLASYDYFVECYAAE